MSSPSDPMPILGTLKAKFEYEGVEEEELNFKADETIYLLFKDESGWAKGKKSDGKIGWFPFDYTETVEKETASEISLPVSNAQEKEDDIPDTNVTEADRGRFNISKELLLTERSYLQSLIKIVKFWMTPLKDGSIIESKYLPKIFCNIEEIHAVTTKLLAELEIKLKNWTEASTIGDVFIQLLPEFIVYIDYLKNHHAAIFTVNGLKERKAFLTWMQSVKEKKEMEGLDLLSFLIMPVQRILRYKLLLEDLQKHTKSGHPDRTQLAQALKQICEIAENVNESIKEEENFQKLCRIQKSFVGNVKNIVEEDRKFIREGPIMKVCRKTDKPRWLFLFNDVLVYASLSEKITGNNKKPPTLLKSNTSTSMQLVNSPSKQPPQIKFLFHRMISLDSAQVKDVPDTDTLKNAFQIMTTEEKSFTVYTETSQEKEGWVNDLIKLTTGKVNQDLEVAPVWIPDKLAKSCMVCKKAFNVVQRRHHCRNCGKVVCGSCSNQKAKIAHSVELARVCLQCYEELKPGERRPSLVKATSSQTLVENQTSNSSNSNPPSPNLSTPTPSPTPTPVPTSPTNSNGESIEKTGLANPALQMEVRLKTSSRLNAKPTPPVPPKSSASANINNPVPPPSVPGTPKPPVRPKSIVVSDLDSLKKRFDELTKVLMDECTSRLESEIKLKQEIQRLSQENQQLKQDLQALKQLVQSKK